MIMVNETNGVRQDGVRIRHILTNSKEVIESKRPDQDDLDKMAMVLKFGNGTFQKNRLLENNIRLAVEEISPVGASWRLSIKGVDATYCTLISSDLGVSHFWGMTEQIALASHEISDSDLSELRALRPTVVPWMASTIFKPVGMGHINIIFLASINMKFAYTALDYINRGCHD